MILNWWCKQRVPFKFENKPHTVQLCWQCLLLCFIKLSIKTRSSLKNKTCWRAIGIIVRSATQLSLTYPSSNRMQALIEILRALVQVAVQVVCTGLEGCMLGKSFGSVALNKNQLIKKAHTSFVIINQPLIKQQL